MRAGCDNALAYRAILLSLTVNSSIFAEPICLKYIAILRLIYQKSKFSLVQFFKENDVINALKKTLAIIAIFNCTWLYAQHNYKSLYRVGLKLGYSFHTLTGDLTESRYGQDFIGGCWFQLKMNKKWTAQTELLLLDKGIGGGPGGKSPHQVSSHQVRLHYFEIPILFQYHRKMIYVEFGPGLGYMINHFESLNGNSSYELTEKYPFIRSELSFNVGIGCALNDKWALGVRLSHSLLPVRNVVPLVSKESYNRMLGLSISRQLRKKKANNPEE